MSHSQYPRPPKFLLRFFRWYCHPDYQEDIEGDLLERFEQRLNSEGVKKARWGFYKDVLRLLRPGIIRSWYPHQLYHYTMFENNLTIALRNLKKHRSYAAINMLGLTLGIASAILIFIFVKYHLSFDTFHTDTDRIYRITTELHLEDIDHTWGVPSPMAQAIRNDFTFAEEVAMVTHLSDKLITIPSGQDQEKFKESIAFAEPAFFNIFNFPLARGNQHTVLLEPNTAIVTERTAQKYFSEEDPMGKTIRLGNRIDFVITGILKDLPTNTDRPQEIYLPYANLREYSPGLDEEGWWYSTNRGRQCFVRLKSTFSSTEVNQSLLTIPEKYYTEEEAQIWNFTLQPLSDIHFNPDLGGYVEKKNLWALALIGLFLVITACVNFINLATAKALSRSKEIGVRKVLGGLRRQLFWQFIAETTLITMLALVVAIILAYIVLPYVNQLFDLPLSLQLFQDIQLLTFLSLLLLFAIFLSGAYPGLIMAGFKPVQALKGKLTQQHIGGFSLRRGLVITQFTISQLLIIGTIIIANQMRYAQQADMGFQQEAIVMLPRPEGGISAMDALHNQVSQLSGVKQATFCNAAPASGLNPTTAIRFDTRTEEESFLIYLRAGDHRYVPTFGLELIAGRNLQPSDTVREYLLNETAVKKLGVAVNQEVIGKNVTINGKVGIIVGVVKDFHNKSLHEAIDPIYITTLSSNYGSCAVKLNLADLSSTMAALENTWKEISPNQVYECDFLDEQIAQFYELDNLMLRLIQIFASIAIIIGCLGLYGLVLFMASQKVKEIGVRKVLGAGVGNILWLFGQECARLLIIAFGIAAPLGWWLMQNWLENFTYRIKIEPEIFALAMVTTFLVATLTAGYQSLKASLANPVDSLRNE